MQQYFELIQKSALKPSNLFPFWFFSPPFLRSPHDAGVNGGGEGHCDW